MATRHTYAGSPQHFNGTMEQGGEQQGQGVMGQMRAATEAVQSQAQHVVSDYPLSTVLAVFGIGLGLGCALGCAMFTSSSSSMHSSSWFPSASSSRWLPSMSSNSSSWLPSGSSNWSDSLVQGAKNMCGY